MEEANAAAAQQLEGDRAPHLAAADDGHDVPRIRGEDPGPLRFKLALGGKLLQALR